MPLILDSRFSPRRELCGLVVNTPQRLLGSQKKHWFFCLFVQRKNHIVTPLVSLLNIDRQQKITIERKGKKTFFSERVEKRAKTNINGFQNQMSTISSHTRILYDFITQNFLFLPSFLTSSFLRLNKCQIYSVFGKQVCKSQTILTCNLFILHLLYIYFIIFSFSFLSSAKHIAKLEIHIIIDFEVYSSLRIGMIFYVHSQISHGLKVGTNPRQKVEIETFNNFRLFERSLLCNNFILIPRLGESETGN